MFILQCTGRSGSTYLGSLLGGHEQILMHEEFLYPDTMAEDRHWIFYIYWSELIAKDASWMSIHRRPEVVNGYPDWLEPLDGRTFGLDLKLEQLADIPWVASFFYPRAERVIILRRSNLLKQVLSYELMMQRLSTGRGPHGETAAPPMKIRLTRVRSNSYEIS